MADWRLCSLFTKKEAITVILWYAIFMSAGFSVLSFEDSRILNNTSIVYMAMYSSIIILYLILGFFADIFIGRYRMIQFGLWIKLITITMSTLMTALLQEYHLDNWWLVLFYSILCIVEMLAHSSFHLVAIQFGTDQLQGASSELLSAFIFWHFIAEIIPYVMFRWIFYSLSSINTKPTNIQLGMSLLNAVFVSVILSVNNCFMSKWFVREIAVSPVSQIKRNHAHYLDSSNPYRLIYHVLKFAKQHKCPVQRSALTYWENDIPSRIDLGKRKYGGPFTTEEVENVKTFLQLFLLLLSLSGILVASSCVTDSVSESDNYSHLIALITTTATVGLLIFCRAVCCFNKCHLSMLRRIGIGAVLTVVHMLSVLVVNSIKSVHITAYVNVILPNSLYNISYIVLTVSLIEFIIAQSPHTMKGMLIGFYYVIRFGVGGLLDLIQEVICPYVHTAKLSISCCTLSNIVITIITLVSFIMYSIVAWKYKLRERDEVVNVHIFAEEYYGARDDDSNSDTDQDE